MQVKKKKKPVCNGLLFSKSKVVEEEEGEEEEDNCEFRLLSDVDSNSEKVNMIQGVKSPTYERILLRELVYVCKLNSFISQTK